MDCITHRKSADLTIVPGMAAEYGARKEPLPRWGHVTVSLGGKVFMWGGRTEDFSESQQKKVLTTTTTTTTTTILCVYSVSCSF